MECAKFRGSRAIVGLVGLVLWCSCAFVGISWIQKFFSWVFVGLKFFFVGTRGPKFLSWLFVGPKFFLVGILWVQIFFLLGISCVLNIFSCVIRGSNFLFLVVDFVIQRFSVAGCMSRVTKIEIQKYISNHAFFSKSISTIANRLY